MLAEIRHLAGIVEAVIVHEAIQLQFSLLCQHLQFADLLLKLILHFLYHYPSSAVCRIARKGNEQRRKVLQCILQHVRAVFHSCQLVDAIKRSAIVPFLQFLVIIDMLISLLERLWHFIETAVWAHGYDFASAHFQFFTGSEFLTSRLSSENREFIRDVAFQSGFEIDSRSVFLGAIAHAESPQHLAPGNYLHGVNVFQVLHCHIP